MSSATKRVVDPNRYAHERKLVWEASGHDWKLDDDDMDIFAFSEGHHNGPKCAACGYSACWHCVEEPPRCPKAKA